MGQFDRLDPDDDLEFHRMVLDRPGAFPGRLPPGANMGEATIIPGILSKAELGLQWGNGKEDILDYKAGKT